MSNTINRALHATQQELYRHNAYLLPLRLFIGIGWIRASLEKWITPGWHDGSALSAFLREHLSAGHVVFPYYRYLITNVFAPNAHALSWIIMIGQMLVGLAILFGFMTNFALSWGLFMNVNFVLAGEVSPSAFYIVIQTVLYVTNIGVVFGFDRLLARRLPSVFLSSQPSGNGTHWRFESMAYFVVALVGVVVAFTSVPFIRDYSPHGVDDPAMLMFILSGVTGLTVAIKAMRIRMRMIEQPVMHFELRPERLPFSLARPVRDRAQ